MNRNLTRSISNEEIRTFEEDGVVCLRGVFDRDWIDRMRTAVDRMLDQPSQWGANINLDGSKGRFAIDTFMYLYDDDFYALAVQSPLPEIAAACLRSTRINLMWDFFLVKEPGSPHPTNWHQDRPFNWIDGWQAISTWMPLDVVTLDSGAVEYVRGSHRWGRYFEPVGSDDKNTKSFFKGADEGNLAGDGGEELPDIEAERGRYDIVHFDSEPGDCVVHHLNMVHGAPGNFSVRRRRAVCHRYTGDDATYAVRRSRFRVVPPREPGLKPGDAFPADHDLFPGVWPRDRAPVLWDGLRRRQPVPA
jgi:ectoine hydroxylase-related dioxygenase (phytanoyl-CoA dioxygenase family)